MSSLSCFLKVVDPMRSGVGYATILSLKSLSFQKLHFVFAYLLTRPYHKNWHADLKSNMQYLHYIRTKGFFIAAMVLFIKTMVELFIEP
jgi:hypothetical protein